MVNAIKVTYKLPNSEKGDLDPAMALRILSSIPEQYHSVLGFQENCQVGLPYHSFWRR